MYTEKELKEFRDMLPREGYAAISVKLGNISASYVGQILRDPSRAANKPEVVDACIEVAQEYAEKKKVQKAKIKGIKK